MTDRERFVGVLGAVTLVCAVVYAPVLNHGFVFDDHYQVEENPWLRDVGSLGRIFGSDSWMFRGTRSYFYRPLMHVAYLIVYQLFGSDARAYHALGVLLHAVAAGLLFCLIARAGEWYGILRGSLFPAFVGSVVFAVHPINAEAVAWIAGVDNLLCGVFSLLALHLHAGGSRRGWRGGLPAAGALLLALLSKETAIVVPAVLLCHDLLVRNSKGAGAAPRASRYGPYAVAVGAYLTLRRLALGGWLSIGADQARPTLDWQTLLCDGPVVAAYYLEKLFFPVDLTTCREYLPVAGLGDPRLIAAAGALAVFGAVAVYFSRRQALWLLGLALTVVPLVPLVYLPGVGQPLADRRAYLCCAGTAMLLAAWVSRGAPGRPLTRRWREALSVLAVGALAVLTVLRVPVFADDISFFQDGVRASPNWILPRAFLGYALVDAGRLDEGIREIRESLAIPRPDALAHFYLAMAYERKNWPEHAAEEYRETARINPSHISANVGLGRLALAAGRPGEAAEHFRHAATLAPRDAGLRYWLGVSLVKAGQPASGAEQLRAAVELEPNNPDYRDAAQSAGETDSLGGPGAPAPVPAAGADR